LDGAGVTQLRRSWTWESGPVPAIAEEQLRVRAAVCAVDVPTAGFVESLSIERWLGHWRTLDRPGKAEAEAELGWTVVDWLYAMQPETRTWWWWAAEDSVGRCDVVVDGWPAPLASAEWMLLASGASGVRNDVAKRARLVSGPTV
jgi:hypothetical protein